jgi:ferrous iron transport protein A
MAELTHGARAVIERVDGEGPFRRHLLELGLVPGTTVERVGQAPLGDPLSFRVRGAVLALRRADARIVQVVPA